VWKKVDAIWLYNVGMVNLLLGLALGWLTWGR
jgi:hypothetical protein